jgi:hypothetical protein
MTASYDALNARVRGILDRAISELMNVGMDHQQVMRLLVIQAVARIDVDDIETLVELRAFIDDSIPFDDDDAGRHVH